MRTLAYIIICAVALMACTKEQKEPPVVFAGDYVYLDKAGCVHIKKNCVGIAHDEGITRAVKWVKSDFISDTVYYCGRCITDECFENLQLRRKDRLEQYDPTKQDIRRYLFGLLSKFGLNTGTWEEFNHLLDKNEIDRKWVFERLTELGYYKDMSFDEFESLIL